MFWFLEKKNHCLRISAWFWKFTFLRHKHPNQIRYATVKSLVSCFVKTSTNLKPLSFCYICFITPTSCSILQLKRKYTLCSASFIGDWTYCGQEELLKLCLIYLLNIYDLFHYGWFDMLEFELSFSWTMVPRNIFSVSKAHKIYQNSLFKYAIYM